jgi:hypothetical protein
MAADREIRAERPHPTIMGPHSSVTDIPPGRALILAFNDVYKDL